MRVEVINTGTELLLGSVLNTHLKFLAESLFPLGLRIQRQVTVPDGPAIAIALREALSCAEIILVTGGLGPTTDDITREITADLLGVELVRDESIMSTIEARFARHGFAMSDRVDRQALRPREAQVLPNDHGTAPGLYFRARADRDRSRWVAESAEGTHSAAGDVAHIFLLPGPPRELRPMVEDHVVPRLRQLLPARAETVMRIVRVAGLGESHVEERVGAELLQMGLELGYCARPGEVEVRVIGASVAVDRAADFLRAQLGEHIVSEDDRSLEKVIVDLLTERKETLALAESCTGGSLANRITNVPGASASFLAGFITYANEAKTRALGVDAALIQSHGAVSRNVAAEMAAGARRVTGATHALATTGIAGPGGGTAEKPVGTVYIALATTTGTTKVERHRFPTDRETFKFLASQAALDLLRRTLLQQP